MTLQFITAYWGSNDMVQAHNFRQLGTVRTSKIPGCWITSNVKLNRTTAYFLQLQYRHCPSLKDRISMFSWNHHHSSTDRASASSGWRRGNRPVISPSLKALPPSSLSSSFGRGGKRNAVPSSKSLELSPECLSLPICPVVNDRTS